MSLQPDNALGILGGIFDPLHNGHLAIATLARDYFGLSEILFVPSGVPPHKAHTGATPSDRLAMARLALKGEPGMKLWDSEIKRHGTSFTIDSLCELRESYPDRPFYFLIGSDNLVEIQTWHRYEDILSMVTLCVAERPGFTLKVPAALKKARILNFPSPFWGVSSTLLRNYLSAGYSCRHLLPDVIGEYIKKNRLYGSHGL